MPRKKPLKFTYVTREQWGAHKAKEDALLESTEPVAHPILFVGVTCCTHTPNFMTPSCEDQESCGKLLRKLQAYHKFEGQTDIPYNFLISQDGTVYEGRGWHVKPYKAGPDRASKMQKNGIDIAYIGDWCHHFPSLESETAFQELMKYGVHKKYVKLQYKPIQYKRYSDFKYVEWYKHYQRVYTKRDNKLRGKGGPVEHWPL